ncbi:MAG: hypothetical protein FGM57_02665 [Candidatus Taylorbacteria bacterium]|nr:hypothetical protein [Candidatus Taylorbacteria bacterium]
MEKQQILSDIQKALQNKVITTDEVVSVTKEYKRTLGGTSMVSKVLYGVGALVAFVGVLTFLFQVWDDLGSVMRISVTLGLSLIAYISAFIVSRKDDQGVLTQSLFALSMVVAPIGMYVFFDEFDILFKDAAISSMVVSGVLFVLFGYALFATRKQILELGAVSFFSWFYYAFFAKLIEGSGLSFETIYDATIYASMALAVALFSYRTLIQDRYEKKTVFTIFTFVSFALFNFSALFLDGVWNLLYAFLLVGVVTLAVRIKSTSALSVSALSILMYLMKISAKYFEDSVGWAVLLIFFGFLTIAVGYFTFRLNKKYISN